MLLPIEMHIPKSQLQQLPNRVGLPGGNDVIVRLLLLEHQPHGFDIIAGIPPVPLGIEIAQIEFLVQAQFDPRGGSGDLAADKGLPSTRGFVVKQNSVTRKEMIGLSIIHRDPVSVRLGSTVRTSWIERRGLPLRYLLDLAEHLAGRGLVKFRAQS